MCLRFVIVFTVIALHNLVIGECLLECKTGHKPKWTRMKVYPHFGSEYDSCEAANIEECQINALRWSATVNIMVFEAGSRRCTFGTIKNIPEESPESTEKKVYLKVCCAHWNTYNAFLSFDLSCLLPSLHFTL
ncbi:hypothetical protein FGIG_11688 [Fasciola gigantica]|uniref:Secreted protein n=1 Tax=Fasciola gigantica TaxID=46835 RepID=A0A504YMN9_FASGI|nr:hypothetical protein FGIG_11688 [Fasciola gigantica]